MSSAQPGAVAVRLIDETGTVVEQNPAMADLANGKTAPVRCREQLQGPYCGTDRCSMVRLMEGRESSIEETVEMELPGGGTREMDLIAERYTTGKGEFEGIIESFRLTEDASTPERVSLPAPTDSESFRDGLAHLLGRAEANGIDVGDRSWECPAAPPRDKWDVSIVPVPESDDGI
jgi:hypothetical protein